MPKLNWEEVLQNQSLNELEVLLKESLSSLMVKKNHSYQFLNGLSLFITC